MGDEADRLTSWHDALQAEECLDELDKEREFQTRNKRSPPNIALVVKLPSAKMVIVNCARCKDLFYARVDDRKRGWGKFCSKRCKAIKQTYG